MSRRHAIYAVDFDGTLCENMWPRIGEPNMSLIKILKTYRKQGNKIILWTCRCGELLEEAVTWCKQFGLEFDAVNENLPEHMLLFGEESRKVFADFYIDDKNINMPAYHVPFKKKGDSMKHKAIESLVIGYLATYLPIFDCSSGRIVGALAIGTLVFMFLIAIEEVDAKRIKNKLPYGLSALRTGPLRAAMARRKMHRSLQSQRRTFTEEVT